MLSSNTYVCMLKLNYLYAFIATLLELFMNSNLVHKGILQNTSLPVKVKVNTVNMWAVACTDTFGGRGAFSSVQL